MTSYYNEIDPYAAQWLRNLIAAGLIPPGDVDERSIADVRPGDLDGYAQCHFFAGLGGWSRALRLAGWPDTRPVWTGSCPCQPFSIAGKRKGFADDRHLWPEWHRLIGERRPPVIFGEQVAKAAQWLTLVRSELEAMGYAVGAIPIEAASVGANHKRDRFWFVADAHEHAGQSRGPRDANQEPRGRYVGGGGISSDHVANPCAPGLSPPEQEDLCGAGWRDEGRATAELGWWSVEPDVGRVAHGIPARVGKLRALGNAIVPQVAAEFIQAFRIEEKQDSERNET